MTSPLTCKTSLSAGGAALLMALSFSTLGASAAEQLRIKKPAPALGLKAPGAGPMKDFHCGANQIYSCDDPHFYSDCKRLGGTVSGEQGWGGKTCWEPT